MTTYTYSDLVIIIAFASELSIADRTLESLAEDYSIVPNAYPVKNH